MRPTVGPISNLTNTAEARLQRLRLLAASVGPPLTPASRRVLSYVTIESANLWAQYALCVFLSSAFGARDHNGRRIVSNPVPDQSHALDLAVYAIHPKLRGIRRSWNSSEMPDFQNKGHLALALGYIGATILPDVDVAVSYQTRVLSDLPTMRNFYAHKGERSARKASVLGTHYGLTRALPPSVLLCTPIPGRPDALLVEWLDDLAAILSLMP